MQLTLRRADSSRKGGDWDDDDFDVFDGDRLVGRIYRVNSSEEIWFWGVSFVLTNRKRYGHADSLDEAKAAFRAEYEKWLAEVERSMKEIVLVTLAIDAETGKIDPDTPFMVNSRVPGPKPPVLGRAAGHRAVPTGRGPGAPRGRVERRDRGLDGSASSTGDPSSADIRALGD